LPRGAIGGCGLDPLACVCDGVETFECDSRRRGERFEAAKTVQHREMCRRVEQRLMLVLPVQFDQLGGQLLECTSGRQFAVDVGAAAPLTRDFTSDQPLRPARALEDRLDGRQLLARPDQVAGGAAAQQQADGSDEDRLTGASLSGKDVQAGVEFELDRIDDREVFNLEKAEHLKKERTPILT
jgi:hypothetical protein